MKRCLLVGAAPSTGQGLTYILKTQSFDAVYAVDGGYAEVAARAITPDAVFGDFDSLGTTPCHPEVYEYDTHKDFTVLSHSDKAEGICEEGLEWNLDNATGVNRALWGISNEFKGVPARISLAHGSLWVTFPLEELSRAYYDRLSNV